MSLKVSELVWEYSSRKGSERLVLLAIARRCNDDGTGAWPSLAALADYTGLSTRSVQYCLQQLLNSGELVVTPNAGPRGCNLYTIPLSNLIGSTRKDCVKSDAPDNAKIASVNANSAILNERNDMFLTKPASPESSLESSVKEDLKERGVVNPRATATAPPLLRSVPKDYSSRKPGQLPNGYHANSPPAPRATLLPPDFQLTSEMEQMAKELADANGVRLDVKMAFRKFVGYFTRGKGRETALEDWEWRFETWIMDDIEKAPVVQPQTNGKGASYAAHDESKRARAIKQRFREETGAELDEVSFR